ncbi:MAG: hypothetical protein M1817_000342 [Caeruleum heppii]|nr:MAG: hypothetical protein M1817_000342 [Caeruleum heppii]
MSRDNAASSGGDTTLAVNSPDSLHQHLTSPYPSGQGDAHDPSPSSRVQRTGSASNHLRLSPTPPARTTSKGHGNPFPDHQPVTSDQPRAAVEAPSGGLNSTRTEKHTLLDIPSRSAPRGQQSSPTSTALTGATVSDSAESIGRDSKRSASGRPRDGSRASSQRTANAPTQTVDTLDLLKSEQGAQSGQEMAHPKKGGLSRFFALLNCCGAPDSARSVETDGPLVPPKKTTKPDTGQTGQAIPAGPQGAGAPQLGSVGLRDPIDEKLGGVRDSDNTDVSADTQAERKTPGGPVATSGASEPQGVTKASTVEDTSANMNHGVIQHHEAISAQSDGSDRGNLGARGHVQRSPSDVKVIVQAPTPVIAQNDTLASEPAQGIPQPPTGSNAVTSDGPSHNGTGALDEQHPKEPIQTQVDLPPPPPPADRTPISQTIAANPSPPGATTPEEKQQWLLPPLQPHFRGRKCLVLDLDETLVHSSFKPLHQADFTIPVEIEGQFHNVYVIKRPGVDQFMKRVGELYEVVVFTASVSKYGDPLLDQLDIHSVIHHRLFRESCYNHQGNYVKDLSQVGRNLRETIIIDNSPTSYIFHPQHAVPISSWFSDAHDNELLDLIPVLEDLAGPRVTDVSLVLDVAL